MRQGCISLGKVECYGCHNIIPYVARYLMVSEEDGVESETGERRSYCVSCSESRGYVEHRGEKGELVLTFFPADLNPPPPPQDE